MKEMKYYEGCLFGKLSRLPFPAGINHGGQDTNCIWSLQMCVGLCRLNLMEEAGIFCCLLMILLECAGCIF